MCAAVRLGASSPPKLVEGKFVLLAIFGLGMAAAGGGWWYQHSLQRRPLDLWGHEAANLILNAGDVKLCRFQPPTEGTQSTVIEAVGAAFELLDCKDAAGIRGMLNLRHSLLSDYSFDWTDSAGGAQDWRYALRFRDDDHTATLLVSTDFHYALLVETGAKASIRPIARGVRDVIEQTSIATGTRQ